MQYDTFKQVILDRLSSDIPEPKNISLRTIHKNNGRVLDGLVITENGCNIAPTLYLNCYYETYQSGCSFQDVYEQILENYEENKTTQSIDIRFYTDFKNMRSHLAFKLIHYEKNRELLRDVPHIRYLDLAVVFYCMIPIECSIGNATILIHNSHMEYWNITKEELYSIARENARSILKPRLCHMNRILQDLTGNSSYPTVVVPEDPLYPMYVLTNSQNMFGAACVLYDGLLKSYAKQFQMDFYILPSSIHEVILIPSRDKHDLERFSDMVAEVNETQLEPEDILSDHAYYYSQSEERILMPE